MPKSYSKEDLEKALNAIAVGMSYAEAKKTFGIPTTTLCDHVKGRSTIGVPAGRKLSLPEDVEAMIVKCIFDSAAAGFPMTKQQVLKKTGGVVNDLKLRTQFKNNIPGDRFWRCFKKRHPNITIRSPECCSHKRLTAMSEEGVASYFEDLHILIREKNLNSYQIWNMDETELQFARKSSKVVSKKGQKILYQNCSDSKETVTVIACINAAGDTLPPMCIVKGKSMTSLQPFHTYLGPANAYWTFQQKRLTDSSLGVEWFKEIFLPHCGPSRPQLLLIDSHSSHEISELLELAREQDMHIFPLPPHSTQRLQPLNTSIFKPLKLEYSKACNDFLKNYPSQVIDKHSFPLIFSSAWKVMEDREMLKKSFASTGIYPPNQAAVSQDCFTPSAMLFKPLIQTSTESPASSYTHTSVVTNPEEHAHLA